MRILFLTTSYPLWPGDGRGAFVHELARRLVVQGNMVHVVAVSLHPRSRRREVVDEVRVVRVPLFRGMPFTRIFAFDELSLRNPLTVPLLLSYIARTVREALRLRTRFDLIHAPWDIPCGVPGAVREYALTRHSWEGEVETTLPAYREALNPG